MNNLWYMCILVMWQILLLLPEAFELSRQTQCSGKFILHFHFNDSSFPADLLPQKGDSKNPIEFWNDVTESEVKKSRRDSLPLATEGFRDWYLCSDRLLLTRRLIDEWWGLPCSQGAPLRPSFSAPSLRPCRWIVFFFIPSNIYYGVDSVYHYEQMRRTYAISLVCWVSLIRKSRKT